jgi:hypothetical protein
MQNDHNLEPLSLQTKPDFVHLPIANAPVDGSFSSVHFPGHCFGPIPAPGSFAASVFPVAPERRRSLP